MRMYKNEEYIYDWNISITHLEKRCICLCLICTLHLGVAILIWWPNLIANLYESIASIHLNCFCFGPDARPRSYKCNASPSVDWRNTYVPSSLLQLALRNLMAYIGRCCRRHYALLTSNSVNRGLVMRSCKRHHIMDNSYHTVPIEFLIFLLYMSWKSTFWIFL